MDSRHRTVRLAAALLLMWAAGCRRPMPEGDAAAGRGPLAGCWSLEAGGGEAAGDTAAGRPADASLPVLALDTVRLAPDGEPGEGPDADGPVYAAHAWFGSRRESEPFSAWRRLDGDSLVVYRPGALAGMTLRLVPVDGELSGVLIAFTDVMEPGRPAGRSATPVRARPVACPGEDGASVPAPSG